MTSSIVSPLMALTALSTVQRPIPGPGGPGLVVGTAWPA
jgi:hypothetical protein